MIRICGAKAYQGVGVGRVGLQPSLSCMFSLKNLTNGEKHTKVAFKMLLWLWQQCSF